MPFDSVHNYVQLPPQERQLVYVTLVNFQSVRDFQIRATETGGSSGQPRGGAAVVLSI